MAKRLQGTIRKRGEVWQVTISTGRDTEGQYRRQSFTCSSEDEAQDKLLALNQAKRRGDLVVKRPGSLEEFIDDWLAGVIKPTRSPRTHELYKQICATHIKPALGRRKVDRLRPQDLQRFYGDLQRDGASPATVNHVHRVLRVVLAQAVDWGYMYRNPASRLKLPREPRRDFVVLSPQETKALIAALYAAEPKKQPARRSLWAPIAVAVSTGLREGELLALQWSDIDFERGVLQVRHTVEEMGAKLTLKEPKTAQSRRTVSLHADTIAVLREHRRQQNELRLRLGARWQDEDLVFPEVYFAKGTGRPGRLRSPRVLQHVFRREITALGHEGMRFHDLRHTHITHLMLAGKPVNVISARVGHASATMTLDRYAHLLPGSQDDALSALDGVLA